MKFQGLYIVPYLMFILIVCLANSSCKQKNKSVNLIETSKLEKALREQGYIVMSEKLNHLDASIGGDMGSESFTDSLKANPKRIIQEFVIRKATKDYRLILDSNNVITVEPNCSQILTIAEMNREPKP